MTAPQRAFSQGTLLQIADDAESTLPETPANLGAIGSRKTFVGGANMHSMDSDVFSSVSSNATTMRESVDELSAGSDNILGDVFREFGRVPLYRDLPPRLRGPSQLENLPDEVALVSIFGRLDCGAVPLRLRMQPAKALERHEPAVDATLPAAVGC